MKVSRKRIFFHYNFYYNTLIKNQSEIIIRTTKGNYVSVRIGEISIKYWLDFTKAENENQYLTDI